MRRLAAMVACAVLCAGCTSEPVPLPPIAPPQKIRWLLEAIRPVVGHDPLECNSDLRRGVVARAGPTPSETLARWFACAREASAARRPFLIVLEQTPFEGWQVMGILGGRDGSVRAFNYYEGCCWPPTPQLQAGVCESPSARADNSWPYGIGCANGDDRGFVPMPELWLRQDPLPPALLDRLHGMTGDGAIDCGFELAYASNAHLRSAERLTTALNCAQRAAASGRPGWVLVPIDSMDSQTVHGLVRQPSGALQEIQYDSAPRGDPRGPAAISVNDCSEPRLARARDGGADFVCGVRSTTPGPPSRPRPGS